MQTVSSVMTITPLTVPEDAKLTDVPVVHHGKPVGMVSLGDLAVKRGGMPARADICAVPPDFPARGRTTASPIARADEPSFATVKTGMLKARRLLFVPLAGAKAGPGYLKVAYPRALVRDAPSIDTDGELFAAEEQAVFRHYELPYEADKTERRLARR